MSVMLHPAAVRRMTYRPDTGEASIFYWDAGTHRSVSVLVPSGTDDLLGYVAEQVGLPADYFASARRHPEYLVWSRAAYLPGRAILYRGLVALGATLRQRVVGVTRCRDGRDYFARLSPGAALLVRTGTRPLPDPLPAVWHADIYRIRESRRPDPTRPGGWSDSAGEGAERARLVVSLVPKAATPARTPPTIDVADAPSPTGNIAVADDGLAVTIARDYSIQY